MNILDKWKEFVAKMNSKGIPVPTIRDPKTGMGSVSLTMVVVSFGLLTVSTMLALGLVVSKWAKLYIAPDTSLATLKEAFSMSFQMAGISVGLYFGRKLTVDKTSVNVEKD